MLADAFAQTNPRCLFLLCLAAFVSSAADRLLQLKLGSISLFLAPNGDNPGAGVIYMLLPMALLLLPITLFFNNVEKRPRYLPVTMQLKAALAFLLSLDIVREFLSTGGARVGYTLSLIFLAGEWTVICMVAYLGRRAPRPLIYLSALAAAYFGGQTAALAIAPYIVSQPFTNSFAAFAFALYVMAFFAVRRCQNLKFGQSHALQFSGEHAAEHQYFSSSNQANHHTDHLRLLAASVLLYTPLYICQILSLFYALQGYQAGFLTFASLATKAAMAFSLGACSSIILHHLTNRRRVLQTVATATVLLAAFGGLSYSYDACLFTLMAVTGLAGFITPDWENHLLSVLPAQKLAPFLAARNTIVMVLIALLSPAVERTLPAVSALYLLKELNILVLLSSVLCMLAAPVLLARAKNKLPLPAFVPEPLAESQLMTIGEQS